MNQLHCPTCRSGYTRFRRIETTHDDASPLGTQGPWIALSMECRDCPEEWRLVVALHDRMTCLGVVR